MEKGVQETDGSCRRRRRQGRQWSPYRTLLEALLRGERGFARRRDFTVGRRRKEEISMVKEG